MKWIPIFFTVLLFTNFQTKAQTKVQKTPLIQTPPSFGVIFNEDGDFAFLDPDPKQAEKLLRANVDGHAALGIKTYVFSLGAGSDALYYPTKVSSSYGWRETKYEKENEVWKWRVRSARACIAAGLDAINIAGDQAKKNHLLFIPSLRMNDSHFMADPYNYPLTGKFWLDHAPDLTIQQSPISFDKNYGNLFDYSKEAVRKYRLAVIEEAIERNIHLMDGFELDFNRVQVFFPKGKALLGKDDMTELVRQVRKKLDTVSKKLGRPMYLFVRIPPSDEACEWAGLDIYRWMKEQLVDLISPAQLMTLAHDMPIQNMIAAAKKNRIQIYPSIYPRTSYRVQLEPGKKDLGLTNKFDRVASLSETVAAALNYQAMGVNGFYLYNYKGGGKDEGYRPHPDWMYSLVATLSFLKPSGAEKVFAITKSYYNDQLKPSYAYVKQLPEKLSGKAQFSIQLGELPNESPFPLKSCVMRIGIKGAVENQLTVSLNGTTLQLLKSVNQQSLNGGKPLTADMAAYSMIYTIDHPEILHKGVNTIILGGNDLVITDIEIGYAYHNQLALFMSGTPVPPLNSSFE